MEVNFRGNPSLYLVPPVSRIPRASKAAMSLTTIIDGNNVALRARAALPDLRTKSGIETGAVFGFITMLINLQGQFRFTSLISCFDWGKSMYRLNIRPEYKSNRLTIEREDAARQFKLIEEFLGIIQSPYIRVENVEADDLIASLSSQIKGDTLIVSADHDLCQLVNDHVVIAKPSLGRGAESLVDVDDVIAKYSLPPNRLAEAWALQGDPGDGIVGLSKIGPKTALKMLAQHGDLWNTIKNDPRCVGFEQHVLENYAMIDLVNGSSGIHIENNFDDSFDPLFYPIELREYFKRLEMHSLVRRFDQRTLWTV